MRSYRRHRDRRFGPAAPLQGRLTGTCYTTADSRREAGERRAEPGDRRIPGCYDARRQPHLAGGRHRVSPGLPGVEPESPDRRRHSRQPGGASERPGRCDASRRFRSDLVSRRHCRLRAGARGLHRPPAPVRNAEYCRQPRPGCRRQAGRQSVQRGCAGSGALDGIRAV